MPPHLGHLVWKLEHGHELDHDDRTYLANVVRAQIEPAAPFEKGDDLRSRRIAMTVFEYEREHDCKREAGVAEAIRVHRVSRPTVYRAIDKIRNLPTGYLYVNAAGFEERADFIRGEWRKRSDSG